jgi:DNA-binding response OmpR family regulator
VRILFVEDHPTFAEVVATQFLTSHQVVFAQTAAGARAALAAEPAFDAVLVDYDLPDAKGTAVIQHLRSTGFAGVVIAVSAKDDGNAELRAAGAHAVCKKAQLHLIGILLEEQRAARQR